MSNRIISDHVGYHVAQVYENTSAGRFQWYFILRINADGWIVLAVVDVIWATLQIQSIDASYRMDLLW